MRLVHPEDEAKDIGTVITLISPISKKGREILRNHEPAQFRHDGGTTKITDQEFALFQATQRALCQAELFMRNTGTGVGTP